MLYSLSAGHISPTWNVRAMMRLVEEILLEQWCKSRSVLRFCGAIDGCDLIVLISLA